ncbi:MAG: transposase [Gammaproteobacteria bacterium]|nr:transposase [Gammaproteobacteria bacterium]
MGHLRGALLPYLRCPPNPGKSKQEARLGELEHLNLKINRAYLLKELFRNFWSYQKAGWAKRYLKKWFWWATHSRLAPMREFAWMLRRHEEDILNYFRIPLDNGIVEGLNNKAKLVIHRAYGFRTAKTYILNLYHCLGALPLPQTMHTFV